MSDYGADSETDLNVSEVMCFDRGFLPAGKPNAMQWSYPGGYIVHKIASRRDGSNVLIKIDKADFND